VGLGNGAGFITGWLYWWFWVVVVAFEAWWARKIVHEWLPAFDVWQIGLALMLVLTAVNLSSARSYGEFEFWFASIKVVGDRGVHRRRRGLVDGCEEPASPGLSHLTAHQGFAPFGWVMILSGVTTVIFSMVGAEIVTVAAAESAESNKTMSRMAANVVLRILLFYILSIALALCIVPWTDFKPAIPRSPCPGTHGHRRRCRGHEHHRADRGAVLPQFRRLRDGARAVRHGGQG
jgi:L-asparagine transporter-like permease